MEVIEDFIDLVVFIALLSLGVIFSIAVVLPVLHEDSTYDKSTVEDKTAPVTKGVSQDIKNTHFIDRFDIVLATQVQDKNVPSPKKLSVKAESHSGVNSFDIDIEKEGIFYTIDSKLTGFANSVYDVADKNAVVKSSTPTLLKQRSYYNKLTCTSNSACINDLKNLKEMKQDEGENLRYKMSAWKDFISKCNGTFYNSSGQKVQYACTVTKVPYNYNDGNVYKDYDAKYQIKYVGKDTKDKTDDAYQFELVDEQNNN